MTRDPIPGFSTYFNRHKGCWAWKEKHPHHDHAELGHVVFDDGYHSQGHATAGIRLELKRRQEMLNRHVEATDHAVHDRQE